MEDAKTKMIVSILLVCFALALVSPVNATYTVGVKKGDWIKYRLKAWTYASGKNTTVADNYIKITINNVSGTDVKLTVESDQTGWITKNYTVNIASNCTLNVLPLISGFTLDFLPIVPANLTVSSTIPEGYITPTTINNVTQYNDQYGNHTSAQYYVNYTTYNYNTYWDRQHGVLLAQQETTKILGGALKYGTSITIEDTNIWSPPINWLLYALIAIIVIVIVVVAVYVFVLRKKKPPTTPPTQRTPPPPPPPPA